MGGGGGAIRTAAKITGLNAGFRGASPADQIAAAALRSATRPAAEEVSWTGLLASQSNGPVHVAGQKPVWELDDWEFAGSEGDSTVVMCGEPLPRVVFGGAAPTLQEAKEASNDLKHALHKIYFSSSSSTGYKDAHESAVSMTPNSEYLENKACIISNSTTDSLPTNALKAFRLFSETPAAESVVASIASDPNVWQAVLQNEALSEFLQSQKRSAPLLDNGSVTEEFVADANRISENSYKPSDGNGFMNFLDGVKCGVNSSVVKMIDSISAFYQYLFGAPSSVKDDTGTDASAEASYSERTMTSILGLAIIVIMIVVLKRP